VKFDGGIVGREVELAAVASFLGTSTALPAALVIDGEPGIGKTTIIRAAMQEASSAGLRVFAVRPAAGEMELPFVALGDLLASMDPAHFAELASPQRAAIEAALAREGSGDDVDVAALARAVLELLCREGSTRDLLVVVDDVQWLDRPTLAALTFAFRRIGSAPIRVLLAARAHDGGATGLPLGVAEWEYVDRIRVGPLSVTMLGALLRERLGQSMPRPQLTALHLASGGNPLLALELAQHQPGEGGQPPAATLPVAIKRRLRRLPPDARAAVSVAGAALRPSADMLLSAGVERTALRSALDAGVLTLDGERLAFAHPLLASSAYDLLLADERREVHARLAAVSSDPVERGHHVARSVVGPDDEAAAELDRAAERAASLGDHAGAAAFLLRAAELSTDPASDAATRRKLEAANAHINAGDVAAAIALSRTLVGLLPKGTDRARARAILVYCSGEAGMSYRDAVGELMRALDDADGDEVMQAELHLAAAEILLGTCTLDQAVAHVAQAIVLAERCGATQIEVAALAALGFADSMLGLGVTDAARQAVDRWDGTFGMWTPPRMSLGCVCLPAMAFAEAAALFEQELAAAVALGVEPVEVAARGHLAEVQLRVGHWADALANARQSLEHARQATETQTVAGVSYALAMTEALLGLLAQAQARAEESLSIAEEYDDFWFIVSHRAVLGLVALTRDEPARAIDALEPAWQLMLDCELGDLSLFPVAPVLGEALVAVGRLDEAADIAARLHAAPDGAQPWCEAMGHRLDALVSAARGEHDAARQSITAALNLQRALPEPFELARSLHIQGSLERRARQWGSARIALTEALDRFDQLGAGRWAEKAAAELARMPGRRPASKAALTAREREIAQLIAEGLSNKEVAAKLYISVSTVEAVLTKAYAKLGVRTRTELVARLNSGALPVNL